MANSSTGMTGTARFTDCGCAACQGGRTHDDALSAAAPEHGLDPVTLARRNHPVLNTGADEPWVQAQILPGGMSYQVIEHEGAILLMKRPITMRRTNDGGGNARYAAETDRLRAINQRNRDHYANLATDPRRAVMGR